MATEKDMVSLETLCVRLRISAPWKAVKVSHAGEGDDALFFVTDGLREE